MRMGATEKKQEDEANYFAMCLLMPEPLIKNQIAKTGNTLETEDDVLILARAFEVSEQIMLIRLIDLRLIDL